MKEWRQRTVNIQLSTSSSGRKKLGTAHRTAPASNEEFKVHNSKFVLSLAILTHCMMLLFLGTAFPAHAAALSARQILEKASKPYAEINNYVVDAHLTAKSMSMHIPDMNLKIYFKKPDKVRIESKNGFAVLPRQGVLFGNPLRELLKGGEFILDKSERIMGVDCYTVKASFRREGRTVDSTVWIDKKDFLVRQISYVTELSPSVRIRLSYMKVSNRYWLPETTWAEISAPSLPNTQPKEMHHGSRSQPMTVIIRFSNYKVNTGVT